VLSTFDSFYNFIGFLWLMID